MRIGAAHEVERYLIDASKMVRNVQRWDAVVVDDGLHAHTPRIPHPRMLCEYRP